MMRSMFSGVAGLKTHQTKMDVIGNNIANVNTVAFKSSSTTFSEIMYQRLSSASGPNANGRGGVNAKQIGLGSAMATTTVNISNPGSTQTTGGAFDLSITGDAFFVVNGGSGNLFTKAGAFGIDGAGNLVMKSTGYNVMGWQVEEVDGVRTIRKDTVSPLRIMTEANLTSPPEATTMATCAGILDKNSKNVNSPDGYAMSLSFVDNLGYTYTAKFAVKSTNTDGAYTVELSSLLDSQGKELFRELNATDLASIVSFGKQEMQQEKTLLKLNPSIEFDANGTVSDGVDKRFKKKVTFPDFLKDFSTEKISLFPKDSYKQATGTDGNITGTTGSYAVKATASRKFTEKELAEYKVIYNVTDKKYQYTDANGALQDVDDKKWRSILGIDKEGEQENAKVTSFEKKLDPITGTMEFTFTQEFAVSDDIVSPTVNTDNTYSMFITKEEAFEVDTTAAEGVKYSFEVAGDGKTALVTKTTTITSNILKFDTDTGKFVSVGDGGNTVVLDFQDAFTNSAGDTISLGNFKDITIDFSKTKRFDNGGASTMGTEPGGGEDGTEGKGKKLGDLIGLSVSQDGTIWGDYDNGNTTLLGQIAVAVFSNPAGLEKVGESCYQTTLNSGEFDGIGQDVTADGGKMSSGVLEMSNVDLSTEFTEMITTQRGFQANSRIITTSDTLLEELINLKR